MRASVSLLARLRAGGAEAAPAEDATACQCELQRSWRVVLNGTSWRADYAWASRGGGAYSEAMGEAGPSDGMRRVLRTVQFSARAAAEARRRADAAAAEAARREQRGAR